MRAVNGFGRLPTDVLSNANATKGFEAESGAAEDNPHVNELNLACAADLDRCPPYVTLSEGIEPDYSDLHTVEEDVANADGIKRTYNCSKCGQPKKI